MNVPNNSLKARRATHLDEFCVSFVPFVSKSLQPDSLLCLHLAVLRNNDGINAAAQ